MRLATNSPGILVIALALIPAVTQGYAALNQARLDDFVTNELTVSPGGTQLPPLRPNSDNTDHDSVVAARSALLDPLADLRHALEVLQTTWFKLWVGAWPTAIDWTSAVVNTHLLATLSTLSKSLPATGDLAGDEAAANAVENELNLYFAQSTAYYFGENAFAIRNEAYDDMLWVVLGWLQGIHLISSHSKRHCSSSSSPCEPWHGVQYTAAFAHRARVFYEIANKGWDTKLCGGGMTWNPSLEPYKNAITNQLYIAASVGMYLDFPGDEIDSPFMQQSERSVVLKPVVRHDTKYLQAAIEGYDWLKHSNMTNKQGLYVDGFHITGYKFGHNDNLGTKRCDDRNEMVFTYNQGVLLSGLRGLWEATGNRSYLDDGHELAQNVIAATGWRPEDSTPRQNSAWSGLGRNGVLEELCDASGYCSQDGHTFKGIFFHHLTLFCEPLPRQSSVPGFTDIDTQLLSLHRDRCQGYAQWVAHNARAAIGTRDEKGRFGGWWGPSANVKGSVELPDGAIDYRNNASNLRGAPWVVLQKPAINGMPDQEPMLVAPDLMLGLADTIAKAEGDLNDRGRGRTVETQSGGLAVLRALWEFQNIAT
ncbi:hypothetical protein LTR85_003518 [Meristemomyces frigidus]|nr:hypothetical protein LTR85_003518 [Meristemomyces frigidus]